MSVQRESTMSRDICIWLEEAVKHFGQSLTFMDMYERLKDCIVHISQIKVENKDVIYKIVEDLMLSGVDDESHQTSLWWYDKEQHTYSVTNDGPFHHAFHLNVARRRDVLYKTYFGYIPCQDQLPSFVQIARAHAMKCSPPYLEGDFLWKALGAPVPIPDGKNIVVNSIVPGRENVREFHVMNTSALEETTSDMGMGEVFSDKLWCTAITFDIDGATVDAREDGWISAYPVDEIIHDITRTCRTLMLEMTQRRWDMAFTKPAIHVWVPEDPTEKKLSMRVSLHLPSNVCFENIADVSHVVKRMCVELKKTSRYLIVDRVKVDGLMFERSVNNKGWRAWDENKNVIVQLEPYLKTHHSVTVEGNQGKPFCLLRDNDKFVMEQGGVKIPIPNISCWIQKWFEKFSHRECLIDEGIYHNNRSIRLPQQSKFVQGRAIRRFVPFEGSSKVTDALMHYPHNDTLPISGTPLLVSLSRDTSIMDVVVQEDIPNMDEVVETIDRTYGMKVTKTTRKNGNVYLDVEKKDGGGPGKGNFCLIKNDWHRNAHMYFIVNASGTLKMKCWSTNCQKKLKK